MKIRDNRHTNIPTILLDARKLPLVHPICFSNMVKCDVNSFSCFRTVRVPAGCASPVGGLSVNHWEYLFSFWFGLLVFVGVS